MDKNVETKVSLFSSSTIVGLYHFLSWGYAFFNAYNIFSPPLLNSSGSPTRERKSKESNIIYMVSKWCDRMREIDKKWCMEYVLRILWCPEIIVVFLKWKDIIILSSLWSIPLAHWFNLPWEAGRTGGSTQCSRVEISQRWSKQKLNTIIFMFSVKWYNMAKR